MSQIKVAAGLAPCEASLLGLQKAACPLGPHVVSSVCSHPGISSSSYRDTRHIGLRPILTTSF